MAKLYMAEADYSSAKTLFETVTAGTEITPKPDLSQQYEARYFSAVCDLLAGDIAAAETGLNNLRIWQETHLPAADPQARQIAKAAATALEYRIRSAKAEQAASEDDKNKLRQEAVVVLLNLLKEHPEYRALIYDKLSTKLP